MNIWNLGYIFFLVFLRGTYEVVAVFGGIQIIWLQPRTIMIIIKTIFAVDMEITQ